MKVKYSIYPFILAVIAMAGLKIMSIIGLDSNGLFMGLSKTDINYIVIGIALVLFIVCVLINLFDRKTAPVYRVKRNIPAGILSVVSGLTVAGSSFLTLMNTAPNNTDAYYMSIIVAGFSIPAAIALILMCKVHFSGKSTVSGISMLFIFPSLWGCSALVSEFLKATKVSISASDMTPLFCYIFISLYLFSHAMIISRIKGRNPVKACFIYGLPCAAISLSYGAYVICTALVENSGIPDIVLGAQFAAIALYAISFIGEMFFGTLTKDEVEIIDSFPDEEDTYENSYISSGGYDELLISNSKNHGGKESAPDLSGLDDFVIGYNYEDAHGKVDSDAKTNAVDDAMLKVDDKASAEKDVKAADEPVAPQPAPEIEQVEEIPLIQPEPVPEPQPTPEPMPAPQEQASGADLTADDIIGSERMSEIDRLLEELEGKK